MKRLILSLAILSVSLVWAQKKEIANAVKAVDSGDLATANSEISKAEAIFGDKTYLLEPSVLEQYYYAKGLALLKSGKTTEGAEYLSKITALGSQTIFSGKDSDKNKVYFVGKAEADKFGNGIELKQEKYTPSLSEKAKSFVSPLISKTYDAAINEYNAKNYVTAAEGFKKTYYLMSSAGIPDESILFNAGLSYGQAEKNQEALDIYRTLIDKGFTGAKTSYLATNIKTGQQENLGKETFEAFKKLGEAAGYKDFKIETSKSSENEIYETYLRLLLQNKNYDEAVVFADKAIAKFPTNSALLNLKGLAYYNAGKSDQYIATLKSQLDKNPTDKESLYNLGVMLSKDPSKEADAEATFKKLVDLDPKYPNALNNLVFAIIGEDDKAINDYKDLRKAGKIDAANKVLEQRRARFQKALPYAEKMYADDPNNKEYVSLLKNFYMTTQNTSKYNEFKTKEAAMK